MSFLETAAFGVLNDVLSEFRSNEGYARPNRFEVMFYPPISRSQNKLGNAHSGPTETTSKLREICLHCEAVTLPARNLNSIEDITTYGPVREIVDGVGYDREVGVTFHSSSDLKERKFFETWQQNAYNETNWNVGYYWDYIGAADIWLLDINEQKRYGLRLNEVFPKNIGSIEFSSEETNTVAKQTVTLQFRYWENLDSDMSPPTLGTKITQTLGDIVERNIHQNIPKVLNKLF